MRQHKWLQRMISITLIPLLLDACSFSVQVLATPVVSPLPIPSASPAVTLTQSAPTTIPASATPTLIPIRVETIPLLQIVNRFEVGDIVRSLVFTPDSTVLAAAQGNLGDNKDFAIYLWNVVNGESLGTLDGHTSIVWDAAFSPDGKMLASVSSDKTAKVWDWRNETLLKSLDFQDSVGSVRFSPDGQTLAVGGVDNSQAQTAAIWIYSAGSWSPLMKFPEHVNITVMAYSPKGDLLVGGGTSRNVQVWRASNGASLFTLNHTHQVFGAAISPDGSTLATATCQTLVNYDCKEGSVWLWNLPTGKLVRQLNGFPNVVEHVAFTVDGSALIAASRDGALRFYDTSNDQSLGEFASAGGISALAVSPDGSLLATGKESGEIDLWKVIYHP